jgi:hypothetical protein
VPFVATISSPMLLSACYYASSHSVPLRQPFTLGRKTRCARCPSNLLTATSDSDYGATKSVSSSASPRNLRGCGAQGMLYLLHLLVAQALLPVTLKFQPTTHPPPHFTPFPPTHTPCHPTVTPGLRWRYPISPHPSLVSVIDF